MVIIVYKVVYNKLIRFEEACGISESVNADTIFGQADLKRKGIL